MHTPSSPHGPLCSARAGCFSTVLALLAFVPLAAPSPLRAGEPPPSRVHALVKFDFADKYLTPRGTILQEKGLTMQTLFLALVNVYEGAPADAVNHITLIPGVWSGYVTSPIATHLAPGSSGTDWIESDPILGVEVGFAKHLTLEVTYTQFAMQILDIGTSEHLETKLACDDRGLLGAFALHPYVGYWRELTNKATAAANFGVPPSYYFEVGIAPAMKVGRTKLEFPMRVLLPGDEFYGETFAAKSTIGLWETGMKATMPMTFMPAGYGRWSFQVGAKYMKFVDRNLQQLATHGGFGSPTRDTSQAFMGFSSFF